MVKTKALISCVFVFAYAKKRFSHNEAPIQAAENKGADPADLHLCFLILKQNTVSHNTLYRFW